MRNCKECRRKNHCMEMSRFIPCTSYVKGGRQGESDQRSKHPEKRTQYCRYQQTSEKSKEEP